MRGLHAFAALGVFAMAAVPFSRLARAQETAPSASSLVRLVWTAPPECPSEQDVLTEMQRVLGGPPSRGAKATAEARQVSPRRWSEHLSTEVEGVAGERDLEADSCDGLVAATALILAWTIDPQRAASALITAPSSVPASPPPNPQAPAPAAKASPPVAPPVAQAAHASDDSSHLSPQVVFASEAISEAGTLPGPGFGEEMSVGGLLGRARLEASVANWLSADAKATSAPFVGQGATLHPLEGGAHGCLRWQPTRRAEVDPCLGGGITVMTSDGLGESHPVHHVSTWGSLQGGVLGDWTLTGPLALRASMGFALHVRPPTFNIRENGDHPFYQVPTLAGRATLGLEVRFP
jgi:hypothetical protein